MFDVEEQIEAQKEFQYHSDVVGAYVTYERDQDIRMISDYYNSRKQPEDGPLDFKLERPVEPNDIIWENMHIKLSERVVRGILVVLSIVGMLYVCSFGV